MFEKTKCKSMKEEKLSKKEPIITKEKYDNVWKKIFLTLLVPSFVGIFYLIRDVEPFRKALINQNPDYNMPKYSDLLICIPIAFLFACFKYYMEHFLIHFCEKIMKHSYRFPKTEKDRELGKNYRVKLPNHLFKGSMYLLLTIFGYCILKDLNYFPKALLGKGWMPNMFIKGYPKSFYYEKTPMFNFYYMFCLSYFSADFIWLLFISAKQTDFIIMLVHHICTISLIVFSYLVNYSNVGSIVLFLHLETDIFVHSTRFLIQTDVPEIFKNLSGLALVFNFLYVRIYVFGNLIYVLIKYITWQGTIDSFLIIFLTFIYMMHINWAIMLVQKMIALFMGTKIVDTREYKVKTKEIKKVD